MTQADTTRRTLTVLTLSIGGQKLAIPAGNLREILDPLPRTRVPGAGIAAPWVMNVRGAVVPLAELRLPLGLGHGTADAQPDPKRRYVVLDVEIGGEIATVAVVADSVEDVITIDADRIEKLPPASTFPAHFVSGLYLGEDGFVLIPDLSAIFTHLAHRSTAA